MTTFDTVTTFKQATTFASARLATQYLDKDDNFKIDEGSYRSTRARPGVR